MAIDVFELKAKLGLDSSGLDKGLKDSKGGLERFGETAKKVGTAAAKAIAGVSTALAGVAVAAVKQASEFETAFAKVQTIMDRSAVSTDELSSGILELSSRLGVASTEIADTVYNAISATGDTANAVLLTEKATKLAVAGFTDTTSALGVLTTAINAYGLSASDAEHISDSLIQVQNLGVTTVGELSTAMGRAIATASAYGVDLENLESAYISLTKGGIATAESTTYLSSMLSELGKDGSEVSKVLKERTGKGFAELMEDGSSLADVLDILLESVDGNTSALMNLWGSQEAGKASNAIISQSVQQFNSNLQTLKGTVGTTEQAFDTMADTMSRKVSVLKETGRNLVAKLGEGLAEGSDSLIDFAKGQIDLLADAYESVGAVGMAEAGGKVLANFVKQFVDNAPILIDTAVVMIQSLVVGISDNVDEMASGALQIMATLIKGIVDTLPALADLAYNIVASLVNDLADQLPTFIANLPDFIGAMAETIIGGVNTLVEVGITLTQALMEGIWQGITDWPEIFEDIVDEIYLAIEKSIDKLEENGNSLWNKFVKQIKALWGGFNAIGQMSSVDKIVAGEELTERQEQRLEDFNRNVEKYKRSLDIVSDEVSETADKTEEESDRAADAIGRIGTKAKEATETTKASYEKISQVLQRLGLKDITLKVDTSDSDKAIQSLELQLTGLGLTGEQSASLLQGTLDEIIANLNGLGIAVTTVNDAVETETLSMLDYVKERYATTMEDMVDTALDLVDDLWGSLADVGAMLVEGTASWEDWGLMALQMIGDTLVALGKQLAAMAVMKALTGDWVGFGMATAGSAAALLAGGALSQYASSSLEATSATDYTSEATSSSDSSKGGGTTIIQNIQSVPLSAYELEQQAYAMADKLRWA